MGYRGILDLVFGCWHTRLTFPRTDKRRSETGMYVACLDCGKQFDYDWDEMRILGKHEKRAPEPVWELRERSAR
jgi:hypothetical protein